MFSSVTQTPRLVRSRSGVNLWVSYLALLSFTLTTVLQILAFGHREEVYSELGNPDGNGKEFRECRT